MYNKKHVQKIEDVFEELIEWFNDGKDEKIAEIGIYNDYIRSISLFPICITIELTDRTLNIFQDDLKYLKIDEKNNILVFSI